MKLMGAEKIRCGLDLVVIMSNLSRWSFVGLNSGLQPFHVLRKQRKAAVQVAGVPALLSRLPGWLVG